MNLQSNKQPFISEEDAYKKIQMHPNYEVNGRINPKNLN